MSPQDCNSAVAAQTLLLALRSEGFTVSFEGPVSAQTRGTM
jgi:hypothetical protein